MQKAQNWENCNEEIKKYILGFVELLKSNLGESLTGVYLHGSLAMGSYFPPKSDIDILAVTDKALRLFNAENLNILIANYSDKRPTTGDIEFSLITADVAKSIPSKIPYILHYSSMWHDRIINRKVVYTENQIDTDLSAHLTVVQNRGICLYGLSIDDVFGKVNWDDFKFAVLDDLNWILADENICESPYYCILNICRALQMLIDNDKRSLSKKEGGEWGLTNLPSEYRPLIKQALDIYRSDNPIDEAHRKTGGIAWDNKILLALKDYVKSELERLKCNPWKSVQLDTYENHMKLDNIEQLQTLNRIMQSQLNCYNFSSVAILGVAGGNGLEHIDTQKISHIYGIDINSDYLRACKERYSYLGDALTLQNLDISNLANTLPCVQLIIADMIIEYICIDIFAKQLDKTKPQYVSCVIQKNLGADFVSSSPYTSAFDGVTKLHQDIDTDKLTMALNDIGYVLILTEDYLLPNNKKFIRLDFEMR
jgi:predicted nucleotidyltransferase